MTENKAKYEARDIAKFFLICAKRDGIKDMSPLKIQKLVYFAHGMYLAMTGGKPLIEEDVYAWTYGPVIKPLYRELRVFGADPVDINFLDDTKQIGEEAEFLEKVWNVFKKYTSIQLSMMTHEKDGPWRKTYDENHGANTGIISKQDIQEYFNKISQPK